MDAQGPIVEITDSNKQLLTRGIVVLDVFAPWCGPCKAFGPVYERKCSLEKRLHKTSKVVFAKANSDDHEDLVDQYNVTGLPTVLLLKNGKEVKRISPPDANSLETLVEKAFELEKA